MLLLLQKDKNIDKTSWHSHDIFQPYNHMVFTAQELFLNSMIDWKFVSIVKIIKQIFELGRDSQFKNPFIYKFMLFHESTLSNKYLQWQLQFN